MFIFSILFAHFLTLVLFDGFLDFAQNLFAAPANCASQCGYDLRRVELEHILKISALKVFVRVQIAA